MSTNIYILRLQGRKYYVGKSDDPMRRYQEHLEGRGSAWTRLHRPIAVERIVSGASPFDEDKLTKEMMAKYGIENVRGGAYVSIELDEVQEEALQRELWSSTDKCTSCGRAGHFAANCYASTDVCGNELVYSEESEEDEDEPTCYRCGRTGHYATACYASTSVKEAGSECYRCGRSGHYASECYASTSVKTSNKYKRYYY
jgi:predicted GIY-YIG superfamily endonuclease